MNHKGFSIILILPFAVILVLVGSAFAYKLYSDGVKAKAAQELPIIPKTNPSLQGSSVRPQKGYSTIQGATRPASPSATVTPVATPSSGTTLETFLEETLDGGEGDLKALDATASASL